MTNKEIKFELAKIALMQCVPMDSVKQMYEWITEEQETDVVIESQSDVLETEGNNRPIEDLIKCIRNGNHSSKLPTVIEGIFEKNNIKTVDDLLNIGRRTFKRYGFIGSKSIKSIDVALEELYGIKGW